MNNEQVVEDILENASERFKTLRTQVVGWRKGEMTMIMGGSGRGYYSDVRRHIMMGGLFATPGYGLINVETNGRRFNDIEDAMKYQLRGQSYDRIWIDEAFGLYNGRAKKADWKCSAMERHIQKGETHKKPSKLIKALVNSMDPTYYNGVWPNPLKGAW